MMCDGGKMVSPRGRRTVYYQANGQRLSQLASVGQYAYMLWEDVHHRIIPYAWLSHESEFRAEVYPRAPEVELLVLRALDPHYEYRNDLTEAVAYFIRKTVSSLLLNTPVAYEIVMNLSDLSESESSDNSGPAAGPSFFLASVPEGSYYISGNYLCQRVPESVAEDRGVPTTIHIPLDKIVLFQLPKSERKQVDRALARLAEVSVGRSLPKLAFPEDGEWNKAFDFRTYERSIALAVAHATRDIGWNARGLLDKHFTEYYQVWRQLRFEEFLIRIREAILEDLNVGLEKAGRLCGFSAKLTLRGLPTRSDVQAARRAWQEGSASFQEILAPFGF